MSSKKLLLLLIMFLGFLCHGLDIINTDASPWEYVYCQESGRTISNNIEYVNNLFISEYYSDKIQPYLHKNQNGQWCVTFSYSIDIPGMDSLGHFLFGKKNGYNKARYYVHYYYTILDGEEGDNKQFELVAEAQSGHQPCNHLFVE